MPRLLTRRARWLLAAGCLAAPAAARAQYAIVVNPASSVDNLSLDQLRRIFLGQTATTPNGKPVEVAYLVPERPTFARSVLGLPEGAVRQRWIGMVFRGEVTTPAQELNQAEQVKRFLAEHVNGVAYLRVADADGPVKVIRVDGKKPSDDGYPVH